MPLRKQGREGDLPLRKQGREGDVPLREQGREGDVPLGIYIAVVMLLCLQNVKLLED